MVVQVDEEDVFIVFLDHQEDRWGRHLHLDQDQCIVDLDVRWVGDHLLQEDRPLGLLQVDHHQVEVLRVVQEVVHHALVAVEEVVVEVQEDIKKMRIHMDSHFLQIILF